MSAVDTYKIIRFFRDERSVVVARGLTIDEAQAHCRDEATHSVADGWFDGYEAESS